MTVPSLIGHRGACGHAPENTLASIRKAAKMGVKWIEFDTMLSADNQLILFHDDALDRTTQSSGLVAEIDWKDLQLLDAGSWFSDDYSNERIPLLSQAFELLEVLGLGAIIEIKPSKGREIETARLSAEMVRDSWPQSLPVPILSSFSEQALKVARDCVPQIPRALNLGRSLDGWQNKLQKFDCTALHCAHDLLDKEQAATIVTAGHYLRCFTVNQPAIATRLFNWGVCSIFTDYPERFV